MTLLSALRATKVLGLSVVLVAGGMTAADARDGWHPRHHHGHHSRFKKLPTLEQDSHGGQLGTELRYDRSDRQFGHRTRDFYSGAISAYRDYGNGTYFYVDNGSVIEWNGRPEKRHRSRSKVIAVTPGLSGCSWEAGVCVIRPGL
ncbi:hypothetical protein [Shinella zoogloeoides]|uniref:hypothetical protein n=1 Tax=Shinella zoogloeoides TaxID=352475 RepID=UPI00273FB818|nr:hypothetical protein [Shinella zoogloeoides]WLR92251.1 hypothetical protein Q9316_17555 [Shinella zoogloeoides]